MNSGDSRVNYSGGFYKCPGCYGELLPGGYYSHLPSCQFKSQQPTVQTNNELIELLKRIESKLDVLARLVGEE